MVALFGVILTQYKAQFYVESEVTQGLYFGAAIFFWMVFVFSLTLICFGMMQRKHLQHVSADYPEIDLRTGRKGKFLLGSLVLAALATAAGFGFGGFGMHYMESRFVSVRACMRVCMHAIVWRGCEPGKVSRCRPNRNVDVTTPCLLT